MWFYYFCRFFARIFYNIFYPHKIFGKENIPKDGNFILVCNHYAKIDVVVVSVLFKKRPYILAKKQLYEVPVFGKVLKYYGLIPVDREGVDFNAMKKCFSVLKDGYSLMIFPEGTRNRTSDELQEIKGGAGLVAMKSGVKVVPMAMKTRFRMFHKNYAYIGEPYDYSDYSGKKLTPEAKEEIERVMADKIKECRRKAIELSEKKGK